MLDVALRSASAAAVAQMVWFGSADEVPANDILDTQVGIISSIPLVPGKEAAEPSATAGTIFTCAATGNAGTAWTVQVTVNADDTIGWEVLG